MTKRHAKTEDEVIQAVMHGYYHFASKQQAVRQMEVLREAYFNSKDAGHKKLMADDAVVLWIKGFEISKKDTDAGLLGHFAHVSVVRQKDGSYGFGVEKIEGDATHPERRRTPQRHPNWGHPVLRSVEKKRVYPTMEEAIGELIYLQQEYPEVAVPGKDSLTIGIYGRAEEKTARRVKRYVLAVEKVAKGWVISLSEKKPKLRKPKTADEKKADEKKTVGKFTARVALKGLRKRK
jgi:hypothetical protein